MAENTHTEVPGKKPFPPFEKETFASQLIWLAVFFIALYVMMSRLVIPRIGGIIAARENRIADDLAEAGRLKTRSDEALADYEKALADARNRAHAIANETRERQAAEAETQRKALEDKLNAKLADAEKTISATKQAAMANVRSIASEAAKAIVERLLGTAPADKTVAEAIADTLKR
ncbi:MAG TPA: F0F1 ATP synthase subunit B [Pseudolabrys sp.]|nr:F0F1 ATP synthase subunit B [Pseudolabrys sp.]